MLELYYCSDLPNEVIDIINTLIVTINKENVFNDSYHKYLVETVPKFIIKNVTIDIKDYVKSKWPTYQDFLANSIDCYSSIEVGISNDNKKILAYVCQEYIKNIPASFYLKYSKDEIYESLHSYIDYELIERVNMYPYIRYISLIHKIIGKQYSLNTSQCFEECVEHISPIYL
jgi:hypothetical protein